ncbi:hypothetical protein IWX46DRAFT_434949 [Phyllosticta citricarpa]|uniref:Secreted peptide n=1 Tax=Phyllosticta citricarpa TaxID=55181 RepID=A0ABR1L269_9PEZI
MRSLSFVILFHSSLSLLYFFLFLLLRLSVALCGSSTTTNTFYHRSQLDCHIFLYHPWGGFFFFLLLFLFFSSVGLMDGFLDRRGKAGQGRAGLQGLSD